MTSCRSHPRAEQSEQPVLRRKITLTGKEVNVDFYLPQQAAEAPVVAVAHGFTRSRLNMAGWGSLLASNGFIVAVPDLPSLGVHARNGRALRELIQRVNDREFFSAPKPNGAGALMGFSAGGLASLLAASSNTTVRCWIGLDPVDIRRRGAKAAGALKIPCLVLQAEKSVWNARGNSKQIVDNLPGPFLAFRVKGAVHVDGENPTDGFAELTCGKSDPARREVFERASVAALRAVLFGEERALDVLRSVAEDPMVKDVRLKHLERFRQPTL